MGLSQHYFLIEIKLNIYNIKHFCKFLIIELKLITYSQINTFFSLIYSPLDRLANELVDSISITNVLAIEIMNQCVSGAL